MNNFDKKHKNDIIKQKIDISSTDNCLSKKLIENDDFSFSFDDLFDNIILNPSTLSSIPDINDDISSLFDGLFDNSFLNPSTLNNISDDIFTNNESNNRTHLNPIENHANTLEYEEIEVESNIVLKKQKLFEKKLKINKELIIDKLMPLIHEDTFEYGIETSADKFIEEHINTNKIATKEALNTIYLDNYSNKKVLLSIIRIISRLNYKDIEPEGPTMAVGVLSHTDIEIIEAGIRAFENWGDDCAIEILESVETRIEWLNEYIQHVISELRNINAIVST